MTSGVVPAQEAPFYKGKTIRIVISTGVAGGYAEYARVLAEHMGRHIAGQPSFIVQSMPGAGGLSATNYLYAQAPQDGTTIGIVHSTVPLAPLWGCKGVRFETLKFNWLGALDRADGMCITWRTSPVKTWSDLLDQGLHRRQFRRGLADGHLSGDAEQAVRHPDEGDRRLQGRHRHLSRDGARRGRRPLRRPAHGHQGDAAGLADREEDPRADPDRRKAQRGVPGHADDHGIRQG